MAKELRDTLVGPKDDFIHLLYLWATSVFKGVISFALILGVEVKKEWFKVEKGGKKIFDEEKYLSYEKSMYH